jgi:hypothetical protein
MPGAVTDLHARRKLGVIQADYLKVISTTRKRVKRGRDKADLESTSDELLLEAHELVDRCCNDIHTQVASHSNRFPVLPESDPRSPALAKLNKEQRRLTRCIKKTTPDAQRMVLNTKIETLFDQALTILESSDPVPFPVKLDRSVDLSC